MPKEKSAGALIYRIQNNIPYYLLLHYHSGHWEFAKGHIEEGENPEEAAKREVEEETGIKDLKILGGFSDRRKEGPSLPVQVGEVHVGVAAYLEIEPLAVSHLTLRLNEIAEAWWVPFEKVQEELQTRQANHKAVFGAKVEGWTEIMIKEFSKKYLLILKKLIPKAKKEILKNIN